MAKPALNSSQADRRALDNPGARNGQPLAVVSAAVGLFFLVVGAIVFKLADPSDNTLTLASMMLIVWGLATIIYAAILLMRGR